MWWATHLDLWIAWTVMFWLQHRSLRRQLAYLAGIQAEATSWLAHKPMRLPRSPSPRLPSLSDTSKKLSKLFGGNRTGSFRCDSPRVAFNVRTSSVYDLLSQKGELAQIIGANYPRDIHRHGLNFSEIMTRDLACFLLIVRSLSGSYQFVLSAVRSFATIALVVAVLSMIRGGHHYSFSSMIWVLMFTQLGYFWVARNRVLKGLREELGHIDRLAPADDRNGGRRDKPITSSVGFAGTMVRDLGKLLNSLINYQDALVVLLSGFWQAYSSSSRVDRGLFEGSGGATDTGEWLALLNGQWVKELVMKRDLALFQILAGSLSMMIFLSDNLNMIFSA